ncbi:unnamed protein product [Amoebophrya sp. A120]|nr:unnamed protein product [Amoebophrya sp. A120]|eukprot:GSA120T00023795001.1
MKRMRRERVSVPSLEVIEGWATLAVRLLRRSLILGEDESEQEAKSVALDAKDRSVVLQHPIHFRDATGELLVQGCGPANASPEEYRNEFLYRAKHASSQPVPQECYDMLKSPDHSPLPHVDTNTTVPNNTGALLRYRVVCRFPVHARRGPNQQARERIKADAKLLSAPIDARIRAIDKATGTNNRGRDSPRRKALKEEMFNVEREHCHCRKGYSEYKDVLEVRLCSTGELLVFLNDTCLGNALHFRATSAPSFIYPPSFDVVNGIRTFRVNKNILTTVWWSWQPNKRTWTFSLVDSPPARESFRLMLWGDDEHNFEEFYPWPDSDELPDGTEHCYEYLILKAQEETLLRCQYYASLPIAQRLWAVLTRDEMIPARSSVSDTDNGNEVVVRVPSLVPARTTEDKRRTYNMLKTLCETYPAFNAVRYALEENADKDSLVFETVRHAVENTDLEEPGGAEVAPTEVAVMIPQSDLPINNWACC